MEKGKRKTYFAFHFYIVTFGDSLWRGKNCARLINTIFENPDLYISTKIPSIYVKSELLKVAVEAKSL